MATTRLTIDEQARLLGHAVWLERRCFEVLGAWIRPTEDPAAALWFAATSRHHGGHARALEALLPATRDHDPTTTVGPIDEAWSARVDEWAAADSTAARVAAARALVAATIESHEELEAQLSAVADAPAIRVLRAILAEEPQDLTGESGEDRR